jgi:hypothetical protein
MRVASAGLFLGIIGAIVALGLGGSRTDVARHVEVVFWFLPVVLSLAVLLLPTPGRGRGWAMGLADFGMVALVGAALGTAIYLIVTSVVPAIFGGYSASSLWTAERHRLGVSAVLVAILIPTAVGVGRGCWSAVTPTRHN